MQHIKEMKDVVTKRRKKTRDTEQTGEEGARRAPRKKENKIASKENQDEKR